MIETEAPPRKKRPVVAAVGVALLALAAAVAAWSLTSLRGLPDVGDPFDVAAFASPRVRDEDNAFVLYRRADALFHTWYGDTTYNWPTASAMERKWLEDNREALSTWRRGTERPDSLFIPPADLTWDADTGVLQRARSLSRLACLEGTRLEVEGDFAGAWGWYHAALRCSRHYGHRGCLIERLIGVAIHGFVTRQITAWASLPGVDARLLRTALDEVRAIDTMTAPMSDAVKCEYLAFDKAMVRPDMIWKFLEAGFVAPNSPKRDGVVYAKTALLRAEAFLKRDPERSRRVLRLVVANWLAYCDRPPGDRPPLDPKHKLVYVADPSASANARLLPPERMNSWFESTVYFHGLFPALDATRNAIDRERAAQAALVVHLASELYEREHGEPPDSPDDLVGPYLKSLPESYARPEGPRAAAPK